MDTSVPPLVKANRRLYIDHREHLGGSSFTRGWLKPEHLLQHMEVLLREPALKPHSSNSLHLPPELSYAPAFIELVTHNNPEAIVETLANRSEISSSLKRTLNRYPYQKYRHHALSNGLSEYKSISSIEHFFWCLGFRPTTSFLADLKPTDTDIPGEFGLGDYAITTASGTPLEIIETKNTFNAIGRDFIESTYSEVRRYEKKNERYCLLLAWPEDDELANQELDRVGINDRDLRYHFNKWKDMKARCKRIRMPNDIFLAPRHSQFDPIGLFRERIRYLTDAVRHRWNLSCREQIKQHRRLLRFARLPKNSAC